MKTIKVPEKVYRMADKVSSQEKFRVELLDAISVSIPDCRDYIDIVFTDEYAQIREKNNLVRGKALKSFKRNKDITVSSELITLIQGAITLEKEKKNKRLAHSEMLAKAKELMAPVSAHVRSLHKLSYLTLSTDLSGFSIQVAEEHEHAGIVPLASIFIKNDGTILEPTITGAPGKVSSISEALGFIECWTPTFELLKKLANEAAPLIPEEFKNLKI